MYIGLRSVDLNNYLDIVKNDSSVNFRILSVIFRCQKYVKKGYMEMTKKNYLETLKSVLGRSILHYS